MLARLVTLLTTATLVLSTPLSPRAPSSPFAAAGYDTIPARLPPLPYPYNALEPSISEAIMRLHHDRHHATYVANFNAAITSFYAAIKAQNTTEVVRLTSAINFNGGGHINHSLFWRTLAPVSKGGGSFPSSGPLYDLVMKEYGSLQNLERIMTMEGAEVQGSGWVWLGWNSETGVLQVTTTHNQDLIPAPLVPIIGIDVWEHAYYLDYKNNRTAYLENIWRVINWREGEARTEAALAGVGW
ncbi:hypothetical protein JCM10213_001686 [Rhodosporidiobolus nylandii]